MIKISFPKRAEQRRVALSRHARFQVFSIISVAAIFLTYIFITNTFTSDYAAHLQPVTTTTFHTPLINNHTIMVQHIKLTSYSAHKPIHEFKETAKEMADTKDDHSPVSPINRARKKRNNKLKESLPEFSILNPTKFTPRFGKRAQEFFKDECKIRFFMTWISSTLRVFGDREFLAVESLFRFNPNSCLMILSNTMDSLYGFQTLKHLTDRGFHVQAITPDLDFLFKNTPAHLWLHRIKNGKTDPGKIPLPQNLSNLIRLAILYKYGGVYIDTDFVVLKDFSSLRNSIGAQSATKSGNWTRLNNAVLIFDKKHPLLYKFMKEFSSTFNGNKWGYNGPYLLSRVVEKEATTSSLELNLTVLPPTAFYPIDWTRIGDLFMPPVDRIHRRWIEAKVGHLRRSSYGVHLWNKQSSGLKIEEGSVMARLIPDHCVICNEK